MSPILKDEGFPYETHVTLANNWAIAHNGVIGIGEPILEDLLACPNAKLLQAALTKCGQNLSITQLEQRLSVKSDKFRALIPCLPIENMTKTYPDQSIAIADNRLKTAIQNVAAITENEQSVVTASILLHNGTVVATDKKIILQCYHGVSMPTLALPKAIISPLVKNPKDLKGFGFSNSSCTFYFQDDSWLKTQLFAEEWPNVESILDKKCNMWTLPEGFYDAVNSLEPFSEDGNVYFDTNVMRSHRDENIGASYEVYGLPKGPIMSIKQLKIVQPFIKQVDFLVPHHDYKMMYFYGDNCRGAIAGRVG